MATKETEILTRRPRITFGTKDVPPPINSYIDRNDRIRVFVLNSLSDLVVGLQGRFLSPDGQMKNVLETITPTTDRIAVTTILNLGEGFLLDLSIRQFAGSVSARRGQCFVQIRRHRGGAAGRMTGTLLADYLTDGAAVGFPGARQLSSVEGPGIIRSITGTDPAAGSEISETVPTNARWRLIAMRFTLVADATSTNRRPSVEFDDGATIFYRTFADNTTIASETRNFSVGNVSLIGAEDQSEQLIPIPPHLMLGQGFRIRTVTNNLQAGDNLGAPEMLVEEWIEE